MISTNVFDGIPSTALPSIYLKKDVAQRLGISPIFKAKNTVSLGMFVVKEVSSIDEIISQFNRISPALFISKKDIEFVGYVDNNKFFKLKSLLDLCSNLSSN